MTGPSTASRPAAPGSAVPELSSPAGLLTYLLDRGLLPWDGVDPGDIVVTIRSSRSSSHVVEAGPDRCYFLKHPTSLEQQATVRHEALVYQALSPREEFRGIGPRLIRHDPDLPLLVLEAIQPSRPSDPVRITSRRFITRLGRRLGRVLAALHDLPPVAGDPYAPLPPALRLDAPPVAFREYLGAATTRLVRCVQQDATLTATLARCRESWRRTTWIHGEVRWPHVVLRAASGNAVARPVLVDYESAGLGEPCWDVGCVIAAYLDSWLGSMPDPTTGSVETLVSRSALSVPELQEAVAAFWRGYATGRRLTAVERRAALDRAVRFAVVRLLWSIFELSVGEESLDPRCVMALQLAHNLARRPYEGVRHLLGIPLS
ncbi:aminoglycoside phosphotransferase family protein [Plantactinospora veratri]|uniref:Aminoglycoside phosphotransferase family protein n=1 Tax=Plantactinospora veratri TaxID=1436122 RepID=A0ABU7SE15_9ACTN